jgi:hypothetical protein
MLLSALIGLISFGVLDFRFVIIDTYLFVLFFVLASYAKFLRKDLYQEKFLDQLMISWSLAGAINIIAGGFGYLTGRTMFYGAWILKYGRLNGFFKDPNVLGPFSNTGFGLLSYAILSKLDETNFSILLFFYSLVLESY